MGAGKGIAQLSLHVHFPKSDPRSLIPTSAATYNYNCIAWAFGINNRNYWPRHPDPTWGWPDGILDDGSLRSFIALFESIGYSRTTVKAPEDGIQKIAIYCAKDRSVKHAARQLLGLDMWTSKLGPDVDVRHTLKALEGKIYGRVTIIMGRPASYAEPTVFLPLTN